MHDLQPQLHQAPRLLIYRSPATLACLETSIAQQVLAALETVTRTPEVQSDADLDLFELGLLDSLGMVELMVLLSDRLGLELSPADIDRDEWATPGKIVADLRRRLGP